MSADITNWKTPASIICDVIILSLSDKYTLATNLFTGFLPDEPNDATAVIDTGGAGNDPVNEIDEISFQVYSRNSDYQVGYNLQNLIRSILESSPAIVINDCVIIGVWIKSNIAFLGKDELDRSLFSSNYRVKIEQAKNTNRI